MLNPKDISNYSELPKNKKVVLEKTMQRDELNYLSSIAFEQFKVSDLEIENLNKLIDKKIGKSKTSFNTILISVLCGLLIGVSVFFVLFQKSKNHPSIYQSFEEQISKNQLNATINKHDTVFPEIKQTRLEHYNTPANNIEEMPEFEMPENLPTKPLALDLPEEEKNEELMFAFIPNAPVVFINNLKVTNYRLYYFKRTEGIDVTITNGLSAQYGNNSDVEKPFQSRSNSYLAHKIIRQAMRLFKSNNITNCIEELTLLYNYNNDDANAQFYLGMCFYQTGKFGLAKGYFQKNLDNVNNIFHQESEFYLAICLLNMKKTEEAKKALQNIVANKGFYSERANEAINKLTKN